MYSIQGRQKPGYFYKKPRGRGFYSNNRGFRLFLSFFAVQARISGHGWFFSWRSGLLNVKDKCKILKLSMFKMEARTFGSDWYICYAFYILPENFDMPKLSKIAIRYVRTYGHTSAFKSAYNRRNYLRVTELLVSCLILTWINIQLFDSMLVLSLFYRASYILQESECLLFQQKGDDVQILDKSYMLRTNELIRFVEYNKILLFKIID